MVLDGKLIKDFRDKINESNYIYNNYANINDRNKWNCICSAMDWIEVSVEYINSKWNDSDNINIKCMNLFTYISSINILWEAVTQLHRVFYNTDKLPFIGQNNIFKNKITKEDDNNYFKTLRSCFGAHPVNLDEPNKSDNKKLKRFASWPSEGNCFWRTEDFGVRLYSNQVDTEDLYIGVNIGELNAFAIQRYEYLKEIIKEIDRQYIEFESKYKNELIHKHSDIIEQLRILKKESKRRDHCDCYEGVIDKLMSIYRVNPINKANKSILKDYQVRLIPAVEEIYNNLQNMVFDELKHKRIIFAKYPVELCYPLEKLSNAMWSGSQLYAFEPIERYLEDIINFNEIESIEELYVLTLAGLYLKN